MSIYQAKIWVAVLLLGIYLLTYSGRFHGIDEIAAVATLESLAREGNLTVEHFQWAIAWTPSHVAIGRDQHLYSKRGLGYSAALAPLWAMGRGLDGPGLVQMMSLVNILATATTALLLAHTCHTLGAPPRRAITIALLYGLSSPAWPYARFLYSEPLTACCWIIAIGVVARTPTQRAAPFLSGLALGISLLIHSVNAFAVAVLGGWWLWYAWKHRAWSPPLTFGLALLPVIALLGFANWLRFGSPLVTGYTGPEERFVWDYAASIPGFLISPGKGLLWFAPAAVVALWGWLGLWQRHRPLALLVLTWILGALAVYGGWFMWWGGWSWGPRYMVALLPLLLLPLCYAPATPKVTWALTLAGLFGAALNFLGVGVDFNEALATLGTQGFTDADTIWNWAIWPPLVHLNLWRAGHLDLAWWAPGPDGLLLLSLTSLLVIVCWQRHHPRRVILAGLVMLALAVGGMARHPWSPLDQSLATLSHTIESEALPGDQVLVELVPYYDYFTLIQSWINRYKAAPPYRTITRGEPLTPNIWPPTGDGRLWLILERTPPGDAASTTEQILLQQAALLDERWVDDLRVVQLIPRPPTDARPTAQATLAQGIDLSATVTQRANALVIDLTWLPREPITTSYKVFVQLLGSDGRVVAQHDRLPQNGFAPTPTWRPGVPISDAYALPDTPAATILIGLYDPQTGARLPLADGSADALQLTLPPPSPTPTSMH